MGRVAGREDALMVPHDDDLKRALAHVLWIGGPPDAGKTTIAQVLGDRHGLQVYHFDRREMDHIRRADPARHPALHALGKDLQVLGERAWQEGYWVRRPVAEQARGAIASWTERVGLAVEDLLALPADRPIVAEGPGFIPEALLPLLASPRQAIWLVPSEAFKRESHARRGKSAWRATTSDPERAYRNHVERDLLMAEHYRRQARALGVPLIEVDGSRSVEAVVAEVEAHFAPRLLSAQPTADRGRLA